MVNTRNRDNGPEDNNQANGNPPLNPQPLTAEQSFQLQMQMMATLNNAVQAIQTVQANQQPQQRDRCGDFMKGHPPTFSYSADPLQAMTGSVQWSDSLTLHSAMIKRGSCMQQDSFEVLL